MRSVLLLGEAIENVPVPLALGAKAILLMVVFLVQQVVAYCLRPAMPEIQDSRLCKSVGICRHRQHEHRFVVRLQRREAFCKS